MNKLRAWIHLWSKDYCMKHREKRKVTVRGGYEICCSCEDEKHQKNTQKLKEAKRALQWD